MIVVEDVTKTFRKFKALDGVSFVARSGEITGLIGPNGAGKTTAMRILYSVLAADQGRVLIDGHDIVANRVEAQRRLGVLPDVRGLYPRLTAREHVRYYAELHGLRGEALEKRILDLMTTLGMEDIADRRAKGFSRGQSLKVSLARALIHDPPNLIFDEPTNGLDIASSRAMRALIKDLRDRGRCVIFCSHVMHEVAALCDRLVILSRGRVVAQGTPDELRQTTGRQDLEEIMLALTDSENPKPDAAPGGPEA
jgi:sodium transport system ATP-binding protein